MIAKKLGMKYKTIWKNGVFCTLGKKEFTPNVEIYIEGLRSEIPFREFDAIMEHKELTFEAAAEWLCEEIFAKYEDHIWAEDFVIRVTVGDDSFSGWSEKRGYLLLAPR